jgi:1,5-anhydro-D-fructose reductase (1,5-anhydro-D-mannitol-forming)
MTAAVAVAGTGEWAQMGLGPALRAIEGVTIAACASPDLEQARRFAQALGVPHVYSGLDEMLVSETSLDLLVVSTPDDHHSAAVQRAAAAGLPVFCEKPLANSAAEADRLHRAVERAGIHATVGFSFRYSNAVQQLRADLQAGVLGTPWLLEMHERNPQFHPVAGRPLTWKGDRSHAAGGAIFEYGAHIVDLGCWLLGPVDDVTASLKTVVPGAVLDDIAAVQLRYQSGAIGIQVASWVLGGGFPGIRVHLHGSAGSGEALIGESQDGREVYLRRSPEGQIIKELDLTPTHPSMATYASRHLRDFLAVISGTAVRYPDTMPTISSSVHVQHVLDSALRATRNRLPVPTRAAHTG